MHVRSTALAVIALITSMPAASIAHSAMNLASMAPRRCHRSRWCSGHRQPRNPHVLSIPYAEQPIGDLRWRPPSRAAFGMVWFHGGSNAGGTSEMYDLTPLVQAGQVMVVTLNYLLGVLGFRTADARRGRAPSRTTNRRISNWRSDGCGAEQHPRVRWRSRLGHDLR